MLSKWCIVTADFIVKNEIEKGLVFRRNEEGGEKLGRPPAARRGGNMGRCCPRAQAAPGGGDGPTKGEEGRLSPPILQPHKDRALGAQPDPPWMAAGNRQSCLPLSCWKQLSFSDSYCRR